MTSSEEEDSPPRSPSTLSVWADLDALRVSAEDVAAYRRLRTLGRGTYGTVYEARHEVTGEKVAIKVVTPKHGGEDNDFLSEVIIAAGLRHPFIARVHSFWQDQGSTSFVMDLCTGGNLLSYARRQMKKILETDPVFNSGLSSGMMFGLLFPMLSSLNYLHQKCIMHRDVKPDNFMLQDDHPLSPVLLTDFGFACRLEHGKTLRRRKGTVLYMAPELLRRRYAHKADIWSLGVTAVCLSINRFPFDGVEPKRYIRKVVSGTFADVGGAWDSHDPDLATLVLSLLTHDPQRRPDAQDALAALSEIRSRSPFPGRLTRL